MAGPPALPAVRASMPHATVAPVAVAAEDGFVEVCGHGRVKRAELQRQDNNQPPPDWARDLDARMAAEQAALVARLAAGSTRQRVAAALLNEDVEAAAGLAASTTDPATYRLALQACRKDAAYRIGHAAQRPGPAVRSRLLTETVADQLDASPRPGEMMALSAALAQDQIAQMDGSFASVGRACRADALKDANRRQLCEQVVRLMPERVRETLEARAFYMLEERLGLAHSPQAMGKAEGDRLQGLMAEERLAWLTEPSCANFRRSGAQFVAAVRQGEVAYLRERFKASSPSR